MRDGVWSEDATHEPTASMSSSLTASIISTRNSVICGSNTSQSMDGIPHQNQLSTRAYVNAVKRSPSCPTEKTYTLLYTPCSRFQRCRCCRPSQGRSLLRAQRCPRSSSRRYLPSQPGMAHGGIAFAVCFMDMETVLIMVMVMVVLRLLCASWIWRWW